MKIKNDGIPLQDRIGKERRENIYYCPSCGNVYVGTANCPLCAQHAVRQVALPKADGMERYRPALTRIDSEKGKLQWSKDMRRQISDVFLQYREHLVQLPYGREEYRIDLMNLRAILVFSATHVLYKWPVEEC